MNHTQSTAGAITHNFFADNEKAILDATRTLKKGNIVLAIDLSTESVRAIFGGVFPAPAEAKAIIATAPIGIARRLLKQVSTNDTEALLGQKIVVISGEEIFATSPKID